MLQVIVDLDGSDRDYISINNVHLPSGRPRYAMKVAKSFFRKCRHRNSYVIMIGDMNIPASMWENQAIPYRQYSTREATHQKGYRLDYLFTDLANPSTIETSTNYYQSDHLPVKYNLIKIVTINSTGCFKDVISYIKPNSKIGLALHPLHLDCIKEDLVGFEKYLYLIYYIGEIVLDFSVQSKVTLNKQVDCFEQILMMLAGKK